MPSAYDAGLLPAEAVVDRSRRYIADSLTPLYYTPVWRKLTPPQRLTYNQINGTYWNELISWFERELAMAAISAIRLNPALDPTLAARVDELIREEMLHAEVFRSLNLLSAPERYRRGERSVLRMPPGVHAMLTGASSAGAAASLLWIMLLMEERSIAVMEISCREDIDALYARVYRAHAADEARHVAVDLELLDILETSLSRSARRINAALFGFLLRRFLLRPGPAARRAVDLLAGQHPELRPLRSEMHRQLAAAGDDPRYRQMMYSSRMTPRTMARLARLPETADVVRSLG